MSDKTVRVLKQIDAAIKCIECGYANPFNIDVLLAAKACIEELERAVLAANEKAKDARIAELEGVWRNPAKLHTNLLAVGYDRMSALHLAGATDYDALKVDAERYRCLRNQAPETIDDLGRLKSVEEFDAAIDAIAAAGNHKVEGE